MRPITISVLTVLCPTLGACGSLPPPDPAVLAPIMRPYIDDALTKPMADLDAGARRNAKTPAEPAATPSIHPGSPGNKLTLGLALTAHRSNFDQVPQPWHSLLVARDARLEVASARYRHDNPQGAPPENDKLLPPTAQELQAEAVARDYSDPEPWLAEAEMATVSTMTSIYVPPVKLGGSGSTQLINISQPVLPRGLVRVAASCMSAVYDELESDSMMTDLVNGLAAAAAADKPVKDEPVTSDSAKILGEVHQNDAGDPKHMAEEAKCGGAEAYAHYLELMRPVFVPTSHITVSTEKKDAPAEAKPNP